MTLALTWTAARMRLTLRNPRAVVFTFAFPLLLLVLFTALHGNAPVESYGAKIRFAQFYAPAIAVVSLITACYTTLVMGLVDARESGLLKRVRGTPLPMGIYLGAWVAAAAAVGLGAVVLLFAIAVPAFGVELRNVPAAVVTLLLGAACLSALGVAVASLVKSSDQATPVVQLTFLPLSFISGIWFPLDGAPDWLVQIAALFPVYHLAQAFGGCFVGGGGWAPEHLAVLALWTAGALLVAARRFRFEP